MLCTALEKTGPDLTTEKLVDAIESIRDLDLAWAPLTLRPSDHQGPTKVWAHRPGRRCQVQSLDLE